MIHFSEKFTKQESFELPSDKNFKDIKPISSASTNEAQDYWDKVFGNERTAVDTFESIEEGMISEILDWDESEFQFDFNANSPEIKKALLSFEKSAWDKLSETEQMTTAENLSNILSNKLDLSENPMIGFYGDNKNNCGYYIDGENKIMINKNTFDDPKEIVDTIAHEMRHAYQHERAKIGETYMDKLYAVNFKYYISPSIIDGKYISFTDYENQLVEVEARAFAKLFKI